MSSQKGKARFSHVGRRTGVNILEGKRVKKHEDGTDVFHDYWTDSDSENDSNRINNSKSVYTDIRKSKTFSSNVTENTQSSNDLIESSADENAGEVSLKTENSRKHQTPRKSIEYNTQGRDNGSLSIAGRSLRGKSDIPHLKARKVSEITITDLEGNDESSEGDNSSMSQTQCEELDLNTEESDDRSTSTTKKNLRGKSINISLDKTRILEVPVSNLKVNNESLETDNSKSRTPFKKFEFKRDENDTPSTKKNLRGKLNISHSKIRKVSEVIATDLEDNDEPLETDNSRRNRTPRRKLYYNTEESDSKSTEVTDANLERNNEPLETNSSKKSRTPRQKIEFNIDDNKSASTAKKKLSKSNTSNSKTRKVSLVTVEGLEENDESSESDNSKCQTPHKRLDFSKDENDNKSTSTAKKKLSKSNISNSKTRKVSLVTVEGLEENDESSESDNSKCQTPHKRLDFSKDENDNKSTSTTKKKLSKSNISNSKTRKVSLVTVEGLEENDESSESDNSKCQTPHKRLDFSKDENDNKSTSTTKKKLSKSNISNSKTRKVSLETVEGLEENDESSESDNSKCQTPHKRLDFSKDENDISMSTTKKNLQDKFVNVSHDKTRNVVEKLKGKNKFLEIDNSVKNQSPLFRVNRHENDDNVTNISTPKSKKVSVSFINSEKNKPSEVDNLRNSQTPLKKIDFNTKIVMTDLHHHQRKIYKMKLLIFLMVKLEMWKYPIQIWRKITNY
ncbi:hypothetical protein CDAR_528421 [Caerostris darwini]|uniref:Uncharacterized protein n=1 Tax=Caerostris darwini TaxID=1538125 RepID=A0AAV4P3I0_9ARAC|nr:hypothetical protein CDAR_528421 [Caerostris darwini]